jgi:hypothetical protein
VNKPICLLVAYASGLAGAVYAQPQAIPDPGAAATPGRTNPSKADPSTATPGVVSPSPAHSDRRASRTDPDQSARVTEPNRIGNLSAGTIIQSPAGETIGKVKHVVPDPKTGEPLYMVVTAPSGATTAIPYSVIAPMFSNGRVILAGSRLEAAPRVSDSQLRNMSDKTWQQKIQKYWNSKPD